MIMIMIVIMMLYPGTNTSTGLTGGQAPEGQLHQTECTLYVVQLPFIWSSSFSFVLTIIDLKTQSGLANNAAVLTKNRFLMVNIGNEDGACRSDVFIGKSMIFLRDFSLTY